ncbi:hypothetical protein [Mycoplasmopsis pulmonis]|nr:hypothetical protein [Mycoplasmopsis pulmonis]MDZ7293574.1 hypothetical protein [Mycoplasmopsis pulmonis]
MIISFFLEFTINLVLKINWIKKKIDVSSIIEIIAILNESEDPKRTLA